MKPTFISLIRRYYCKSNHSFGSHSLKQAHAQETPFFSAPGKESFIQPSIAVIRRKCEKCEEEDKKVSRMEDKKEEEKIQKKENAPSGTPPKHISNYLSSMGGKGQPLPTHVNQFFSAKMGYDFTTVKVHTDQEAAASAKAIHAKAYTYQNNIVFNENQFRPETFEGKQLLAHELTHVLQQAKGNSSFTLQRIACESTATAPPRVAQGQANPRDARANAIIAIATGNGSMQQKATDILTQIICQYYPSDAALVDRVGYHAGLTGLDTTSVGTGTTTTGLIRAGDYFINNTTNAGFARRVLQVGHELEHIRQYRSGLAGANNQDQREFLAFAEEALANEFEGTGRMSNSTRVSLIDGAIGYYFCLSSTLQATHQSRLQQLQQRRQALISSGKVTITTPSPATCRRQG